jgi:PAS domain S-box-containing protein
VRVRADGRRIEVIVSMSPLRDETGAVVGLASVSRPASGRELADARFASLLEAAPDAMVCVDAHGAIVLVNAQVSAVFGFPREELLGKPLELLLPDERHRGHRDRFFHNPRSRPMGTVSGSRRVDATGPPSPSRSAWPRVAGPSRS